MSYNILKGRAWDVCLVVCQPVKLGKKCQKHNFSNIHNSLFGVTSIPEEAIYRPVSIKYS